MTRAIFSCLMAVFVAPIAHAAERVSSLFMLPASDELLVQYATRGCTHHLTYEFRFFQDSGLKLSVVQLKPRYVSDTKILGIDRIDLGTVKVNYEDQTDLDRLLRAYHSTADFLSSTTHDVTITQLRGKMVVASETFSNHPGPRHGNDELLTFDKVVRYVRQEGK